MASKKQIAVIGAGASGLIAVKCLKEAGFEPVCFEKTNDIGGLWKYHEDDVEGIPSVPWYTVMDHSKEMWAFSDFPPKRESPNFMRHTEVYNYLAEFVQHFDLLQHVVFKTNVVNVRKSQDFEESGRWMVKTLDVETLENWEDTFDGVFVCSGHLWDPNLPTFLGMDKFQGRIVHTHSLKNVNDFTNKKVVVIGSGSSGLDAAVEIANVAKQVYLSSRSGIWTVPRLGSRGLPNDTFIIRQWRNSKFNQLGVVSKYFGKDDLSQSLDHELYNLKPSQNRSNGNLIINDSIALKICSGALIVKKKVKEFVKNGVSFEEDFGNQVEVDDVVLATGYNWKFPFLERGVLDANGKRIDLYKCVYPPHLKHGTLAFIGFINPIGPAFPVFEIQCRWASRVLAKEISLSSRTAMLLDIAWQYERNTKRFGTNRYVFLKTDYMTYMQDIASKIGARPNLLKLFFMDPKLFYACYFGPMVPYQYRLQGPNAWPVAREVIFRTFERIIFPLHGSKSLIKVVRKSGWPSLRMVLLLNVTAAAILVIVFLRMLKQNPRLRYYLMLKLFPYVNMVQQLVYRFRNTC